MFALQLAREARAAEPGMLAWIASAVAILDVVGVAALLVWPA